MSDGRFFRTRTDQDPVRAPSQRSTPAARRPPLLPFIFTFAGGLAAGALLCTLASVDTPGRGAAPLVAAGPAPGVLAAEGPAARLAAPQARRPALAPLPAPAAPAAAFPASPGADATVAHEDCHDDELDPEVWPEGHEGEGEGEAPPEPNEEELQALLAGLAGARTPEDLTALEGTLWSTTDPRVWAALADLARHGVGADLRAAALELLGGVGATEARAVALGALEREHETPLLLAAARALEDAWGGSLEEAQAVVPRFAALTASPDAELRGLAVGGLAGWYRSPEDLQPVVRALGRDPDPEVRMAAARALERSGCRDPRVVDALTAAATRQGEDPAVRAEARAALDSLGPVSAGTRLALAAAADQDAQAE